jgi:hypothetical protein
LASVQISRITGYHLPIPLGIAILALIVPLTNFFIQPLVEVKVRQYSDDYLTNAIKVLHVLHDYYRVNEVNFYLCWISLPGRRPRDTGR